MNIEKVECVSREDADVLGEYDWGEIFSPTIPRESDWLVHYDDGSKSIVPAEILAAIDGTRACRNDSNDEEFVGAVNDLIAERK